MASTVRLKRSAVQGKAPVVGDLELGELAVNTYDGKLYMKKNDGGDSIVEITAAGGYTDPLTTNGDILIRSGGATTRLGIGSEGQALLVSSGLPVWGNVAGGYTDPLTTDGDIVIRSGGSTVRLGIGSEGQVLKVSSGLPVWAAESGGYTDPLTTDGDIVIRSGGSTTRLGIGSEGQVLKVSSGLPVWAADAGGLADVVDDTTPQLGGNLDVNGNYIISASGGDVEIAPDTTGSFVIRGNNTDGSITLNCTANTHGVTIQSPPHASAATYTLILPDDTGTSGQVLSTNGTGTLSWLTATQPGDNISTLTNDSGYITTGSTTSDAAPSTPSDGDLWYRSSDGRLYVYYDDGSTAQWVDANPNLPPASDTFERSGTTVSLVNSGDTVSLDGDLTVDTDTLHVDSTNNRVGIGTATPSTLLHLSSTGEPKFRIQDADLTDRYVEISQAGGGTFFRSRADSSNGQFIFSGLGGGTEDEFLRIDSSGRLLVGNTSEIQSGSNLEITDTDAGAVLTLGRDDSSISAGNGMGAIDFYGNAGGTYQQLGRILSVAEDTHALGAKKTGFAFYTNSGTGSASERVRIDGDGKLGVGTTTPGGILNLDRPDLRTDTWLQVTQSGTEVFSISQPSNSEIRFATPDLSVDREFTFHTKGTERMRILAAGGLTFNGDTATANALDDYEEGTWTPTYLADTTNPTITYATQSGKYTKIGNTVHCQGRLSTSAVSGGSGNLEIGNFPFACASGNDRGAVNIGYAGAWDTQAPETGHMKTGDTKAALRFYNGTGATSIGNANLRNVSSNDNDLLFDVTYEVA